CMSCGGKTSTIGLVHLALVLFAFVLSADAMTSRRECREQCGDAIDLRCGQREDQKPPKKWRRCRKEVWRKCHREKISCPEYTARRECLDRCISTCEPQRSGLSLRHCQKLIRLGCYRHPDFEAP